MRKQRLRQNSLLHKDFLDKSPTGGNVDGHACMHRYISIGRDNRYEQVRPQAWIANACQQHGSCLAAECCVDLSRWMCATGMLAYTATWASDGTTGRAAGGLLDESPGMGMPAYLWNK